MSDITIHVQFVDEQTGRVFAETHAPLSTLPRSFEAATQLDLGGQQWDVVAADPVTAEDFARSGRLVLMLRRAHVGLLDAKDILYTLPTICEAIPPVAPGTSKLQKHVLELHEDEWRQIEFISSAYEAEMQAELREIQRIRKTESVGLGFRALHLRERIPTPLALPLPDVEPAFPDAQWYDGLAYQGVAGLIEGGFGFEAAGAIVYGQQQQPIVTALCLAGSPSVDHEEVWNQHLKPWMIRHGLLLVDWCRCVACDAQGLERFGAR